MVRVLAGDAHEPVTGSLYPGPPDVRNSKEWGKLLQIHVNYHLRQFSVVVFDMHPVAPRLDLLLPEATGWESSTERMPC
jgi:hypothetical protein